VFAFGYVAPSIARFVSLEVRTIVSLRRLGLFATFWRGPVIAVLRMETVIHVALEVVGAMKPRANANENVPVKPLRTVVAGGSAAVRSRVIVTIGTIGCYFDTDLGVCSGGGSHEAGSGDSG